MGKIKYIKKVREFFRKNPVVAVASLKKLVGKKYIHTLINYLIKKKEIKKITRGYYSIIEDPTLAVYCFKPAYIGLQDALSIHNLWEQETNVIILTARKVRTGTRNILGSKVIFKRISPKYFFGFEYIKSGELYVPISDIEKTFVDMVYYREKINKEILQNLKERTDKKKLKKYLRYYPNRMRKNRIFQPLLT